MNGGSGAYRTLEHFTVLLPAFDTITSKPIIGFSAATPIFTYLQQNHNWTGIVHGALLDLIVAGYYENSTEISIDPLKDLLFGNINNEIVLPVLTRIDNGSHFSVPMEAKVTGGSIRQIVLSMGTPYKVICKKLKKFVQTLVRNSFS